MEENISKEKSKTPNYKLFWIDENRRKHTVKTFFAENDEEALEVLKAKKAEKVYDKELFYGDLHILRVVDFDKNGKKIVNEFMPSDKDEYGHKAYMLWKKSNTSTLKQFLDDVCFNISYYIFQKPYDWYYKIRDFFYLLKHREAYQNKWNLGDHLLDSMLLNVPSLIENSYGMKFIDDAIIQLHGNDEGFELKKYHQDHCSGYPKDVEELAMKIQKEEYEKLLEYINKYCYYSACGVIDLSSPKEVAIDKKWHHTLPVKEGSYDKFDYDVLNKMTQDAWENIWNWVKKHGQKLYD